MWDSEFIGEAILDESFKVSPKINQQFLLDLCADMKTKWFIINGSVKCWIDDFKRWQEKNGQPFPVNQD